MADFNAFSHFRFQRKVLKSISYKAVNTRKQSVNCEALCIRRVITGLLDRWRWDRYVVPKRPYLLSSASQHGRGAKASPRLLNVTQDVFIRRNYFSNRRTNFHLIICSFFFRRWVSRRVRSSAHLVFRRRTHWVMYTGTSLGFLRFVPQNVYS
jgi:hypothetical protein